MRTVCLIKRYVLAVLIIEAVGLSLSAQNLVPNPDFETYSTCPVALGAPLVPLEDIPWYNGNLGTSDYYNACSNGAPDVPNNVFGSQFANSGDGYMGIYVTSDVNPYREYIQVQLLSPLVAGQNYLVSFYVSLADNTCASEHIDAYLSEYAPPYVNSQAIVLDAQVQSNFGFLFDETSWTYVSGCFIAQGDEEWLTIGNFHSLAESPVDPACTLGNPVSYFYIDDVFVGPQAPEGEYVFDLGDPVYLCDDYIIDPDLIDVSYLWEDGSTDPTLHVSTTGTYAVTVSQGCLVGIDSLEVNIGGLVAIDLGPDEVTICEGESYDIFLYPSWSYNWNDGSTASNYSITTSGTYHVTMDDGCSITEDEITVIVLSPPEPFSLGPDPMICPSDELEFDFDPDLGVFHWQDNNSSSTYSITTSGSYALTISNVCGEESDDIVVTVVEPPFLQLDNDFLLCAGNNLVFNLDPTLGDFEWQDGSNNASYTIAAGGNYSVTVSNLCGDDVEDFSVVLWSIPIVVLPDTLSACTSQFPITLDASQTTNATHYLWENGSTASTIVADTAGIYNFTVSNTCFSVQDSVVVIAASVAPQVILPGNLILCPGEHYFLTNNGSDGDYIWQDQSTGDTLLITSPGIYSLTVTTDCGTGSDTIDVQYLDSIPIPNLGPDVSLCPGEQLTLLPNIITGNISWQDMSTADSLLVTVPGIYFVQVSDACTSAADTLEVILNNNPPQLALPASLNLCQGDTLTLDAGIVGVTYSWNDLSQSSTLTVFSPGEYNLTVSNACGTDVDTVLIIDAGPLPAVSLGNDVPLCPGDVFTLAPVFSNVSNWLWNDGSTADTYVITGDDYVTVEATNACGVALDTLLSFLLPATPMIDLGSDTSLCPGNTLLLMVNTPNVSVEWSDGSVNNQIVVDSPGNYFATISNLCGENSDTINVGLLPPAPELDLGIDQSLCPGEVVLLSPGVTNATYVWQDGSTSTFFNATQAVTIILSVSNLCGIDSDTLEITESTEGPHVNLGNDVAGCEGDIILLAADISGVNYLWQDGSTSADFTTSTSGEFILEVSNNCGSDTDTVLVNFNSAPEAFDLGPDTTICPGQSFLLQAPPTASTIQWQDGSSNSSLLVDKAQIYSLVLTNDCGFVSDELSVGFDDNIPVLHLDPVKTACPGELISLDATQLFPVTYQWNTGAITPSIVVNDIGTYSVEIQAPCSTVHDETEIILADTCFAENSFFVPNVFSPNGDNINDVFRISLSDGIEVHSMQASIFDRWGNMVFSSTTIPLEWDGGFSGKPLNPGVYAYRIEMNYFDRVTERKVILHGDVTLIR